MIHTGHPQTSSLDKKDRRGVSDRETKDSRGFQTPMQVPWVYFIMMVLGYSEAIIMDLNDLTKLFIRRMLGVPCVFKATSERAHILEMIIYADVPLP